MTAATGPLVPNLTVDTVKVYLGVTPADTVDDTWLGQVVAAVNALVGRLCADRLDSADTFAGAAMLAGRLYGRRNSSQGIAAFADLGAMYVSRFDPDIEQLLRIGYGATPAQRVG